MKSRQKSREKVRHFMGICNQCAEGYEAHSKGDNLIGTEFKCKKLLCEGRVRLELRQGLSQSVSTKPSKRFC